MQDKSKNNRKKYAAPEALYNLDGEHYVKTPHERDDSRYTGSPGAPTIDLSKKLTPLTRRSWRVTTAMII